MTPSLAQKHSQESHVFWSPINRFDISGNRDMIRITGNLVGYRGLNQKTFTKKKHQPQYSRSVPVHSDTNSVRAQNGVVTQAPLWLVLMAVVTVLLAIMNLVRKKFNPPRNLPIEGTQWTDDQFKQNYLDKINKENSI